MFGWQHAQLQQRPDPEWNSILPLCNHTNLFLVVEPIVKLLAVSTCSDTARLLHRICCCTAT